MNRLGLFLLIFGFVFGQALNEESTQIVSFKNALYKYNSSQYLEAKSIIENLSKLERDYFSEEVPLLKMRTEYRLNNYSESKDIGKSFLKDFPMSDYKIDVTITFGDIFVAESNYESAFRIYINALRENADKKYKNKILKRIFLTLQFGISNNLIDELLTFELDNDIIQILLLTKAQTEIQSGNSLAAQNVMQKIDNRDLGGISKDYHIQLIEKMNNDNRNVVIPVILPLSGRNTKIGQEFLAGLKYAQSQNSSRKVNLSFIVHDNASDELATLKVFNKLSGRNNLPVVLGPIESSNSIIAASFSSQKSVPIILPNATYDGIADISDDLFLLNSNFRTRGELAAKFIVEKLNAKNIAVLAPADKNGQSIINAFKNELNKYELSPIIVEWYSGIPMNLERQFESIRIKAWEITDSTTAIISTIDSMLAIYKKEDEEMTEEDSSDVVLTSIDAIYMPINKGHLDYVGAQFPAYNLETTVVGNDNWAELNILQKENIGPHLNGLIVISNFNHCQIDYLNNNFEEKHSEYFYQAIDSFNLLEQAISISNEYNKPLKQVLSEFDGFKGIFGTYNFSESGNVNTNLNIVRFDGYSFEKYEDLIRPYY